nr:hypothetical protein [Kibdelosporangium sp. MJ126-NF4]CEL17641.1 hypothetical protein [Kibdelosporangium sp. MJ126-NF4]
MTVDRGSLTVFMAGFLGVMMLMFAFVMDNHVQLQTIAQADALAAEGARAALTAVDTRGSTVEVDMAAAVAAAQSYLAHVGSSGTVRITAPRTVEVVVTVSEPAIFGLFGSQFSATGSATAELQADTRGRLP